MREPIRTDYNPRHYRFERRIEGFYPQREPESSALAWFCAGLALGVVILAAFFS